MPPLTIDPAHELQRMAVAYTHAKRREPSFIAAEIAQRMVERLSLITVPVASVHLQCLPSDTQSAPLLTQAFGAVPGLPAKRSGMQGLLSRIKHTVNSNYSIALNNKGYSLNIEGVWPDMADLMWSNLAAISHPDPLALPTRWASAVRPGGFVMFSSLGPDTAQELVKMFAQQGAKPNTRNLVDMHDWGDALVHAGFANPVMDMEKITLTYRDAHKALLELSAVMATKPLRAGLVPRTLHTQRLQLLEAMRNAQGVISITLEVVYGHAFKAERTVKTTGTSVDELKATLPSKRP